MVAASTGLTDIVQLLVKRGADPKFADYKGRNLLQHAAQGNNSTLCNWLCDNAGCREETKGMATEGFSKDMRLATGPTHKKGDGRGYEPQRNESAPSASSGGGNKWTGHSRDRRCWKDWSSYGY